MTSIGQRFTDLFEQRGKVNFADVSLPAGRSIQGTQIADLLNFFRATGNADLNITQISGQNNVLVVGDDAPTPSLDDIFGSDYSTLPSSGSPLPSSEPPMVEGVFVARNAAKNDGTLNWVIKNNTRYDYNGSRAGFDREKAEAQEILKDVNKNMRFNGQTLNIVTADGEKITFTEKDLANYGTIVLPDGTREPATMANLKAHTKSIIHSKTHQNIAARNIRELVNAFMAFNPGAAIEYRVPSDKDSSSWSGNLYDKIVRVVASLFSYTPMLIDKNGDGFAVTKDQNVNYNGRQTSWVEAGSDDIFVVLKNDDGTYRLAGEATSGADDDNAFTEVAAVADVNGDGKLDSKDAAYSDGTVMAWHDKNGDAVMDAGELTSLADQDVASINLGFNVQEKVLNFNEAPYASQVTLKNGQTRDVIDILFNETADVDAGSNEFATF